MRILVLALLFALSITPVRAAELVLFETSGCLWCLRWKEEVGRYYHRTEESRLAPLRKVDMRAPLPGDLRGISDVRVAPTFVLVDRGREIGRITGYSGQQAFWAEFSTLLRRR